MDNLAINITSLEEEIQAELPPEVFENDNFIVTVPNFISPNGDGFNDSFSIRIERKGSEVLFVSAGDTLENAEITSNPEGFLLEGSLIISNNCEAIFVSQDVNSLVFDPVSSSIDDLPTGNYSLGLRLVLDDGEIVEMGNALDISRFDVN